MPKSGHSMPLMRSPSGLNKLQRPSDAKGTYLGAFSGFASSYLTGAWNTVGGSVRAFVDRYAPTFRNTVVVKVHGGPRASMNDLYCLTLSACFGAMGDRAYASSNEINIQIDRTNKVIQAVLTYESVGLLTGINILSGLAQIGETGTQVIQNSVSDEVRGQNWPAWISRQGSKNMKLPMIGETIAAHNTYATESFNNNVESKKKLLNYAPYSDGVARDSDLTLVVAAALMDGPCVGPVDTKLIQGEIQIPPTNSQETNLVAVSKAGSALVDPNRAIGNRTIAGETVYEAGGNDENRWTRLIQQGIVANAPNLKIAQNYDTTPVQNPSN